MIVGGQTRENCNYHRLLLTIMHRLKPIQCISQPSSCTVFFPCICGQLVSVTSSRQSLFCLDHWTQNELTMVKTGRQQLGTSQCAPYTQIWVILYYVITDVHLHTQCFFMGNTHPTKIKPEEQKHSRFTLQVSALFLQHVWRFHGHVLCTAPPRT